MLTLLQQHQHQIDGNTIDVSYHRLSTRLTIKVNQQPVFSSHICFRPFLKQTFVVGQKQYQLRLCWLVLWQAKLYQGSNILIEEILPIRRRKSFIFLGYTVIASSIKLSMVLLLNP